MKNVNTRYGSVLPGLVAALAFTCWIIPTSATAREWEHEVAIYGWFSDIDGTVHHPGGPGSGADFSYDASDILDNLEMIFMGGIASKYDKWSILADVVYMDVGDSKTKTFKAGSGSIDLDLSSWIVSGAVAYEVVNAEHGTLNVLGGVRYTTVDVDADLDVQWALPSAAPQSNVSESEAVLDGIVGIRGRIILNDNWYLPYHADIGTGGSELTWQLFAGVGYRFSWGDIRVGYRYLSYDFDDDQTMEDMALSGPVMGIGFRF
ncbi:hypothetical protein [Desulfogranum marinum]|uniref:hypothetical protein n=1 Tax=Desulfogranum marinum TaxID=453220 RepID=UPI0019645E55|nr:hypothetical protein [Desulfogranum marinum]MBM9513968.1 hypothetical protein [Desulfogranum marinum]